MSCLGFGFGFITLQLNFLFFVATTMHPAPSCKQFRWKLKYRLSFEYRLNHFKWWWKQWNYIDTSWKLRHVCQMETIRFIISSVREESREPGMIHNRMLNNLFTSTLILSIGLHAILGILLSSIWTPNVFPWLQLN